MNTLIMGSTHCSILGQLFIKYDILWNILYKMNDDGPYWNL